MKRGILPLLLLIAGQFCFANNGESSRVLIHTLNYLSQDYAGAVKDGKIISQSEFHEMQEFGESAVKYYKECSTNWAAADSAAIGAQVYKLDSLIDRHAPFEVVSKLAIETRDKVIKASGIKIFPSEYPNLENGKLVFKTECVKCHGENGLGDGPEGKELNPRPRNFHDDTRMRPLSPFFIFNTVRLGVEGTGMKAHPELDDDEVWDVAFYVLTLRYQQYANSAALKEQAVRKIVDSLKLEQIATTSDEEFAEKLANKNANEILAAIRYNQPVRNGNEFIQTSLKYLDGAMALYTEGKYNEASELATLSYLEGIEPIEMQLKSNDPQLMARLEQQVQRLSKLMEQKRPAIEVHDSLVEAKKSIEAASLLLGKKEYSFMMALLMAVSILLREGLEAFLVIMVILSILKASDIKTGFWWVHAGWLTAVAVGVVIWFASGAIINSGIEHMELLEGSISVIAVLMLLYIGFWLHGKSEIGKWKDYINRKMKGAIKNESMIGLAALSFFVVFREVFESVLFLSALNIESGGKQVHAIGFGVLAAFILVIVLAALLLNFSAKLPIPKLFKISSAVMAVLAVILAGKGIHSFQETGHVPIHGLAIMRAELLGVFPTIETCLAQVTVIIIVVVVWNLGSKAAPKK